MFDNSIFIFKKTDNSIFCNFTMFLNYFQYFSKFFITVQSSHLKNTRSDTCLHVELSTSFKCFMALCQSKIQETANFWNRALAELSHSLILLIISNYNINISNNNPSYNMLPLHKFTAGNRWPKPVCFLL